MTYTAPVEDVLFALRTAAGLDDLLAGGLFEGLDADTVRAVIEEAGKLGEDVLAPLSKTGDRQGATLRDGRVATAPGWKEAYEQFRAGGWNALPCPEHYGGQGLPSLISTATTEIWNSANLAFGLCPLLTQGAIDALEATGSEALKGLFLPRMVSGEWTGTMNLTEPQAGSDLAAITAKAMPDGDGAYRVFGTKIFITYGDHELTDNIVHMVLARLPDAPPGTKGISLFLVPKFLVNVDGSLGARNDVACAGLEHKLGIHGSPTCVMQFGEKEGAVGYLVGEENRGLAAMFIMMNAARLGVGVQGVAVAERATQLALSYAKERRQGRAVNGSGHHMSPIIEHPDVKRMLLTMRALTRAARAICLVTAREADISRRAKGETERQAAAGRAALLTPIAKAFSTDVACEVASLGVQVHGGMGFIEETGAAQHYRDARILPIYEGTNGIQAIDLVARKLPLGGGEVLKALIQELGRVAAEAETANQDGFGQMGRRLTEAVNALAEASLWMARQLHENPQAALAGASAYLRLFGISAGGCYLAKGALAAARDSASAPPGTIALARFFAETIATQAPGLLATITTGADAVLGAGTDALD